MENMFADKYKKLGANIALFRRVRGLSQLELAEKINVSRTHISRIENSDSAVSLDVVFAIAQALDVPVHRLFDFDNRIIEL